MTPTPEQNAKRETPTQHEISDANRSTGKSCGCHYGGFICTRTPGHDGLHVASNGTKAVKSWPVETSVVDPEKRIADLETELQQKQKIIENHCKDWAEDDTAIKELCKRCGVADVHPVGDDFKSCVECVEELAEKLQQLRLAADGMRDAAKELLTFHPEEAESGAELPRECWTPEYAAAVDGVTNALLAYRAAGDGSTSPAPQ